MASLRRAAISVATVGLAATTLSITGAMAPPPAAAQTTASLVTRSAHTDYLSCPAPDVLLTVSIQRGAFAPGQLVTYRVSMHNLSNHVCGFHGGNPAPGLHTPNSGLLGICGPLTAVIDNAQGVDVYPGPIAVMCPAVLGPELAPGATITANGNWNQRRRPGVLGGRAPTPLVPPGRYRLHVGGKVIVPFVLAAPTP